MISNERCHLEVLAEENNLPFFSVRQNSITINSEYFTDPVFRRLVGIFENESQERQTEAVISFLDRVCFLCKECLPRTTSTHPRIEIRRIGYNYQPDAPLFETKVIKANKEQNLGTVCLVDDYKPLLDNMGEYLSDHGFRAVAVYVPQRAGVASDLENRLLAQEIMDHNPDILISDKGLGRFSGISLIQSVRQLSEDRIRTVMITGEPETRETHKVADFFIEKPVGIKDINDILGIEN